MYVPDQFFINSRLAEMRKEADQVRLARSVLGGKNVAVKGNPLKHLFNRVQLPEMQAAQHKRQARQFN